MNEDFPKVARADTIRAKKPLKNTQPSVQKIRLAVQIAFAGLCLWIGVEFHQFVKYLESGGQLEAVTRPPGVDGFLPISSLMSFYHWIISGEIHWAHPAGFFILAAVILMSWILGKSFCSWLCPVGFLSELLGDVGRKLFRRQLSLPRWLDYPLRSLKYLLLAFFVYSIFFLMTPAALRAFLDSPYNQVADVKMYYFFAEISRFSLMVVAALFLLSILVRNFWCRYLCPYGALLGIVSLLSPNRIVRNKDSCIDCAKCAKVCPSLIKVDQVDRVISDECTTCMQCVDSCPVSDTLYFQASIKQTRLTARWVAAGVVAIFVLITGLGMLTGNWQSGLSSRQYLQHQQYLRNYGHPTGAAEIKDLNQDTQTSSSTVTGEK
ncbi:MAG: 4Fe-4S binding protein [bacterium]